LDQHNNLLLLIEVAGVAVANLSYI